MSIGIKHATEWYITANVFNGKPTSIIIASASGDNLHQSHELILYIVVVKSNLGTKLLINS